MPKTRCLTIRWGAYGDLLYCLPTLEALKREYGYLHLETGSRGKMLFAHHPAFDRISEFDVGKYPVAEHMKVAELRWKALEDAGWDKVVNFWRCLEVSCIAEEGQEEFFYPRERRKEIFSGRNFYETHFRKAGLPIPEPFDCGTFHFDDATAFWMEKWKKDHGDTFSVAIALCGSTGQKVPFYMKELAREIIDSFPGTNIYLVGNKEAQSQEFTFGEKNVCHTSGTWSYLQSLALMKLVDYVIGPETSLLVGAGMFGTPKSMICTSCGVEQATKYHKNDFSIQSTYKCSPCYRAIYNYQGKASQRFCNFEETHLGHIPGCNLYYDKNKILEGVEFAYNVRGLRRSIERIEGTRYGSLPDLRTLRDSEPNRDKEVRPVVSAEIRRV